MHYVMTTLMCHFLLWHLRHFPHVPSGISAILWHFFDLFRPIGRNPCQVHFLFSFPSSSTRLVRFTHLSFCIALLPENPPVQPHSGWLLASFFYLTFFLSRRPATGSIPLPTSTCRYLLSSDSLAWFIVPWYRLCFSYSFLPYRFFDQLVRCISCNNYLRFACQCRSRAHPIARMTPLLSRIDSMIATNTLCSTGSFLICCGESAHASWTN